jgi:hypothetical protein
MRCASLTSIRASRCPHVYGMPASLKLHPTHPARLSPAQEGAPKNPRAVAEAILAHLPPSGGLVSETSLAGPGFINIRISPDWLAAHLTRMVQAGSPAAWAPRGLAGKKVVVDFRCAALLWASADCTISATALCMSPEG